MNQKKIDDTVQNTSSRAKYFQDVQVWPVSEKINYKGWLNNFSGEDKYLASIILDFFTYYPERMVNQMLNYSIGRAGEILAKNFTSWNYDHFKASCYYSSIPGETVNLTDSGLLFIRKVKEMGIPEDQIKGFDELFDILEHTSFAVPVILVDDFVGSGEQCKKAWQRRGGANNKTLYEILNIKNHKVVFAPLIINNLGYNIVTTQCKSLDFSYSHILNDEYNLFSDKCGCWNDEQGEFNKDLFDKGIDFITRISKNIGIPDTNGKCVTDYRGYKQQGLALAFDHGVPDATLPMFYWCTDGYTPLLKKAYER